MCLCRGAPDPRLDTRLGYFQLLLQFLSDIPWHAKGSSVGSHQGGHRYPLGDPGDDGNHLFYPGRGTGLPSHFLRQLSVERKADSVLSYEY